MELEEIIKPYTLAPEPPKRPGAEAGPAAKRHLGDTAAAAAAAAAGGAAAAAAAEAGGALGGNTGKLSLEDLPDEIDANAVEKILEQADEMHVEEITEASIKRCAAQLERRIKKNQHDRIKFANNPEKWIKSEVDLDEELKRWSQVAASPSLFPQMFENGVFDLLVSLLSHANTDLAVDTAEVLTELTEADTVMEAPDPEGVVGQLMGSHLPEMVVDLLCRLKEDGGEDDALGISSCLTVIENLIELNPSLSLTLTQSQKLPAFLFRRIRGPPGAPGAPGAAAAAGGPPGAPGGPPAAANGFVVDGARLHAAEVLTLLLQHLGAPEKAQIGGRNGADGVDKLLRAIAPYRKKDPESSQEEELVLNLFDSLCSLLLVESNRELLGKQQGVELMLRIIKERRHFTPQAVKALDFALMDSAYNCNTFVERLGLRFLFSMFLGKEKDPKKKQKTNDELTGKCFSKKKKRKELLFAFKRKEIIFVLNAERVFA
ncbi:nuclear associated protein, putative [Eimeria tenella]|uniref:Nuclear associated protein, putative n=1 Tax=Eimeria tenella TaxID=5802 RepID=U6KML6_EIMTE|nr:nuclear associated protein, putative [Eimeria tenella]CDJ38056.1 nuclear associated protein, putative [Eimeria tenella]|eukprot:XP_013228894.1 nuclear associated protein, putative [Eimeria tenella]